MKEGNQEGPAAPGQPSLTGQQVWKGGPMAGHSPERLVFGGVNYGCSWFPTELFVFPGQQNLKVSEKCTFLFLKEVGIHLSTYNLLH